MHSERPITVVLDITRIRVICCEDLHVGYIVWLKQYFHIRQAILPVPAELIPEQGTLSIQFIPEMDGVFYHFTTLRLKVATEDRVDTTVVVDIFRIDAQWILLGNVVVVVLADIPHDVVRVTILVEVGSMDAVPESGVVFKSRLLNAHQSLTGVLIDRNRHQLPYYDKVRPAIVVVVGPQRVCDHSTRFEITAYFCCSVLKYAVVVPENIALR